MHGVGTKWEGMGVSTQLAVRLVLYFLLPLHKSSRQKAKPQANTVDKTNMAHSPPSPARRCGVPNTGSNSATVNVRPLRLGLMLSRFNNTIVSNKNARIPISVC